MQKTVSRGGEREKKGGSKEEGKKKKDNWRSTLNNPLFILLVRLSRAGEGRKRKERNKFRVWPLICACSFINHHLSWQETGVEGKKYQGKEETLGPITIPLQQLLHLPSSAGTTKTDADWEEGSRGRKRRETKRIGRPHQLIPSPFKHTFSVRRKRRGERKGGKRKGKKRTSKCELSFRFAPYFSFLGANDSSKVLRKGERGTTSLEKKKKKGKGEMRKNGRTPRPDFSL